MKNLERKKASSVGYSGRRKKKLRPKRLRVRPCRIPRPKDLSRNCRHCPTPVATASGKDLPALPPLPTKKPDLPPIPNAPDMAKEMERKNLERKLERIADDRAERMSDVQTGFATFAGIRLSPGKTSRSTALAQARWRSSRHCLSCPNPAEPNPTCRLCPSRAVRPQCLLCRSRKVSRIFRLCPNQKPVVRGISHPFPPSK